MASIALLAFESQFRFSDHLAQLLDRIDCRAACSEKERGAFFRRRAETYLRESAIGPDFSGAFSDPYDCSENASPSSITPLQVPTKSSIGENIRRFRFTTYKNYKSFFAAQVVRALTTC